MQQNKYILLFFLLSLASCTINNRENQLNNNLKKYKIISSRKDTIDVGFEVINDSLYFVNNNKTRESSCEFYFCGTFLINIYEFTPGLAIECKNKNDEGLPYFIKQKVFFDNFLNDTIINVTLQGGVGHLMNYGSEPVDTTLPFFQLNKFSEEHKATTDIFEIIYSKKSGLVKYYLNIAENNMLRVPFL